MVNQQDISNYTFIDELARLMVRHLFPTDYTQNWGYGFNYYGEPIREITITDEGDVYINFEREPIYNIAEIGDEIPLDTWIEITKDFIFEEFKQHG